MVMASVTKHPVRALFSIAIVVLIGGFVIWRQSNAHLVTACVFDAADVLTTKSKIADYAKNAENWYMLSADERKGLLAGLQIKDCTALGLVPQDIRDKTYQISVKKIGKTGFQVEVRSAGFDNTTGTSDDFTGSFKK
jgi:hypothetical protein